MRSHLLAILAAGMCLGLSRADAQPPPPPTPQHGPPAGGPPGSPGAPPRKQARAVRANPSAPHLDGRLDDAVWREAIFVSDFLQKDPTEGAPPKERTEVGFLYDDAALYIGARMYSDHPESIRRLLGKRDDPGNTERIIISLDTYHDLLTAYSFAVSATGVRSDYYHSIDDEYTRDHSYDPVWEGRAAIDSTGWTAEFRLPFSQLRFNDAPEQLWGLNLNRWVPQRNEDDFWIPVPKSARGWSSYFGELRGIAGVRPSRRLEVLPYVASNTTLNNNVADADPFHSKTDFEGRAGADLKMGLGPNLTLDGTINPDFGQVEADPAEVNLTQFETIFDERRPFFIEGSQLLGGNGPGYYYSRRIGAQPLAASGDYVNQPGTTTILGAAKVTGRLASGLSVGGLTALTDREYADTYDATTGVKDRALVAARTGYGVLRMQQQFGASQSTVGLSLTGVSRDLTAGSPLADLQNRHAYTGGGDWVLRSAGARYQLTGFAGLSYVEGTPHDIVRMQESSAHYFQRPDAGHVQVDTTLTSMHGWTSYLSLEKIKGKHWLWTAATDFESPGFELNDIGRLQSADDIDSYAQLHYRETKMGKVFRDYDLRLTGYDDFNFGGVNKDKGFNIDTDWDWKNFWHTYVGVGYGFEGLSDDLTRGGPLVQIPPIWNVDASLSSNFAATAHWRVAGGYYRNELGSWNEYYNGEVGGRLGNRWGLTLDPSYSRSGTARQYVTTLDGGSEATYGSRYVFAHLDQSTLRMQIRLTYSFTPDLTLEGYAEPFAATGQYIDFGELKAARTNNLRFYGTDGTTIERDANDNLTITDGPDTLHITTDDYPGDFRSLSYRSNVVLRWEWRRGSTLYFIWQKNRGEFAQSRDLVRPSDLWDAFRAEGADVLALKATYWLPVN